jgi:pimeloyl-ACP methyl ester carboxylesterase
MGGRFALATLEGFSTQIDKVILIAPDGISEHPLYRIATRFKLTRQLFKTIIFQYKYFLFIAKVLSKLRIVPEKAIRFALKMLDSPEKQKQVYSSWLGFRELTFKMSYIAKLIHQENIEVLIFVGKFDAILPQKKILPLSKKLSEVRLVLLETGHTKLVEKATTFLMQEI